MKEFEKWFKKADSDLKTIQLCITAAEPPCDTCCFHAQQAAEKYLKAYLVAHFIDFPKTHDLIELLKICSSRNDNFEKIKSLCAQLKNYGVSPRYPDDMDEPTFEDATHAYQNSLAIKTFVTTHFFD